MSHITTASTWWGPSPRLAAAQMRAGSLPLASSLEEWLLAALGRSLLLAALALSSRYTHLFPPRKPPLTLYKLSSTQSLTNILTLLPSSLRPLTSLAVTRRYRALSAAASCASCSHSRPVLKLYRGVAFFAEGGGGGGEARRVVVWSRRRWRFILGAGYGLVSSLGFG